MNENNERIIVKFVTQSYEGLRIDKYLSLVLNDYSRSFVQKVIKDNGVIVNDHDVKNNYKVQCGDVLKITMPDIVEPEILPENIPLDILYEDDDLIVVNKPKGMVVHPAAGHYSGTLVNALMYHCKDNLSGINGVMRPGIVHRIDMNTTGVLVACKNDFSHNGLSEQLAVHSITRKYNAIVYNPFKIMNGTIDAPIGRNSVDRKKMSIDKKNGKRAVTHYHVIENFGKYAYIECQLETGRTHQIRVHMNCIGHPILGDDIYGSKKTPLHLQGQTLHARVLGFIHPRTGKYMQFEAKLPEYFEQLLLVLKRGLV